MTVSDEIMAARRCSIVHCGLSAHALPSLPDLATEFGLSSDPSNYTQIDLESARRLVELILRQDLAYGSEIMPAGRAAELADRFLAQFCGQAVQFFTNGSLYEFWETKQNSSGLTWSPVTKATFDTGVLILGNPCCGCLWVEDED